MNLKTYQAKSMSEALARVKSDLGKDAVILHTRTLQRGGVLGLGARRLVEITATSDTRAAALRGSADRSGTDRTTGATGATGSLSRATGNSTGDAGSSSGATGPDAASGLPVSALADEPPVVCTLHQYPAGGQKKQQSQNTAPSGVDPALRRELGEIRAMVQALLRRPGAEVPGHVPGELIEHYSHLLSQEVEEALASELLARVQNSLNEEELGSPLLVRAALQNALREVLPPAAPLKLRGDGRPTVAAFVGPTGVGKTTTIAKLAANMKLRERKRVGLITVDSYRIAAVEQLKTYADILRVPLISVLSPEEMRSAVARMADCDLVLVDTAGRSQRDEARLTELGEMLGAAEPDQVHLVLSVTSREETMREAVERFAALGAGHVVFTKLDESVGFGVILNVLRTVDLRLSYLTSGQSVPDDIEIGSGSRVAQLILSGSADPPRGCVAGEAASSPNRAVP